MLRSRTQAPRQIKSSPREIMQIIFSHQPRFQAANPQPKKSFSVPSVQVPNFPEYSDLREFLVASGSQVWVQVTHVTQRFPQKKGVNPEGFISSEKKTYIFLHKLLGKIRRRKPEFRNKLPCLSEECPHLTSLSFFLHPEH